MTQIVETTEEFFAYSGSNVFIDGNIFGSQKEITNAASSNYFSGMFRSVEKLYSSRSSSYLYLTSLKNDGEVIACKIIVEETVLELTQSGIDQQFENAKQNLKKAAEIALSLLKNRYDAVQSGFIEVPRLKEYLPAALGIKVNWWTFQNGRLTDQPTKGFRNESESKISPLLDELISNYRGAA